MNYNIKIFGTKQITEIPNLNLWNKISLKSCTFWSAWIRPWEQHCTIPTYILFFIQTHSHHLSRLWRHRRAERFPLGDFFCVIQKMTEQHVSL